MNTKKPHIESVICSARRQSIQEEGGGGRGNNIMEGNKYFP